MLDELLALLMYHSHNIHILHWKTFGPGFQPNHEYLDELYGEMIKHIDLVAEIILQRGENPISYKTMLEYVEGSIEIKPNMSYDEAATFGPVIKMFEEISSEIDRVYKTNDLERAHSSELETIQSWYKLRYLYLIPRKLLGNVVMESDAGNILNILNMLDLED